MTITLPHTMVPQITTPFCSSIPGSVIPTYVMTGVPLWISYWAMVDNNNNNNNNNKKHDQNKGPECC